MDGKSAIVIGAGQSPGETVGNGRAAALLYASEGANVLLVDKNVSSANETAELIRESQGPECAVMQADIARLGDCDRVVEECISRFGDIDVLHNNVGITLSGDVAVQSADAETWRQIFEVNLIGTMLACKAVLPHMKSRNGGSIINISSIVSITDMALPAYKASKASINALTVSVASECAQYGVRCNAVLPGLINTPIGVGTYSHGGSAEREDLIRRRHESVPLRRQMGSAWDVAKAALFLASDDAKFITGVLLPVDGGQSITNGATRF